MSSDLPTSKEIMGDFGLYFKNGNFKALAECLEEATHINWEEKSKKAIEIANRFGVNQIIEKWKQVFDQ